MEDKSRRDGKSQEHTKATQANNSQIRKKQSQEPTTVRATRAKNPPEPQPSLKPRTKSQKRKSQLTQSPGTAARQCGGRKEQKMFKVKNPKNPQERKA